jgi:hypothetical protein
LLELQLPLTVGDDDVEGAAVRDAVCKYWGAAGAEAALADADAMLQAIRCQVRTCLHMRERAMRKRRTV